MSGCQEFKYVHRLNPNGHPAKTTCETLGLESIRKQDECYVGYKSISKISGYTKYQFTLGCADDNPNHCLTNTNDKKVYFTADHCPIHASKIDREEGMICKTCKGKRCTVYTGELILSYLYRHVFVVKTFLLSCDAFFSK